MFDMKLKGDFRKVDRLLRRKLHISYWELLEKYGAMGVEALQASTPIDSGKTASSWYFEIEGSNDEMILRWCNSNVNNYVNIAIILDTGHATRGGTYVQGLDYIYPALQPIFQGMADSIREEVIKA